MIREIFCPLVGPGTVALLLRHEGSHKGGKLVNAPPILHRIIACYLDLNAGGSKCYLFTLFHADHAEFETSATGSRLPRIFLTLLSVIRHFCLILFDGLVIPVYRHLRIINKRGNPSENSQSLLGTDVEKLPCFTNTQIRQLIDEPMNHLFRLAELDGLQRCINLERQRYRRIVQLLRAHIHGANAFPDFDPILPKTRIGQYVHISLAVCHNR